MWKTLTVAVWDAIDPILGAKVPSPVWGALRDAVRDSLYLQFALSHHKDARLRDLYTDIFVREDSAARALHRDRWDPAQLYPELAGEVYPDPQLAHGAVIVASIVRGALEEDFHQSPYEYIRQEDMADFNRAMANAIYSVMLAIPEDNRQLACTRFLAGIWQRQGTVYAPDARHVRALLRAPKAAVAA